LKSNMHPANSKLHLGLWLSQQRTGICASAGWLLVSTSAVAQSALPEDARSLRPVVVTATPGIAQSAFDAAASIDVIDAQQLQNAQLQINLSETLVRVPGVVAQNRQNYAQDLQISIRGFGARSTFGVRGLRLYADGIPASGPDGQGQVSNFDLSSASRIEVLRGPFSALYGNSSGGVISIFTADGGPKTVVEFDGAAGSNGVGRGGLKFSGTTGQLQYNISASQFQTDGLRPRSAAERSSFNSKFKYTASPDTQISVVLNGVAMPDVQDPLGLSRAEFNANPRQTTPGATEFNTRKSVSQKQGGLVLDHRLSPNQSLQFTGYYGERSVTQFQSIPVATQAAATQPGGVIDLNRNYSGLDARWVAKTSLGGSPVTLTFGAATDRLNEDRKGFQNFSGATLGVVGALRRDERNDVTSNAIYAQAQVALAERWSASAGLRSTRIKFESKDNYIVPGNGNDSGSTRFKSTTPALGLVFHASDTLNVYAAAGRGFESPTLNELAYRPNGATGLNFGLNGAVSQQWELGVKAELTPQWRLNAAYFEAKTSNELAVLSNSGGRSTFQNAGATQRTGVEASLAGQWGTGWSTYLAATVLNAQYKNSFLTCGPAPCTTPNLRVADGNRLPGVPRVSLFAEIGYQHKPWGLDTGLEMRHTGKVFVDDRNTDAAPKATVFNLRASLTQNVGKWTFKEFLRIDNITDKNYVGSVIVNEGNSRFFEPAPGRTGLLGVTAKYTF
jgi:iron complex outermembrane recepter protein